MAAAHHKRNQTVGDFIQPAAVPDVNDPADEYAS
jgi:hypothetical protein